MITAATFATLIVIYTAVTIVWDLLDPDAVKVTFRSRFRLLVAACYVGALLVMALVVLL